MNRLLRQFANLAGIIIGMWTAMSVALPNDTQQEMVLEYDTVTIDARNGETKYSGNVTLTQGSLKISAEELHIVGDLGEPEVITAIGSPATVQQQPAIDKAPISAKGARIQLVTKSEKIIITGQAELEQEGAVSQGQTISYDRVNGISMIEGGSGRAKTTLPAKSPPSTNESESDSGAQ